MGAKTYKHMQYHLAYYFLDFRVLSCFIVPNEPIKQKEQDGGPTQLIKHECQYKCWGILIWIGKLRPGNKTIWVVFDEESEFLGPRT